MGQSKRTKANNNKTNMSSYNHGYPEHQDDITTTSNREDQTEDEPPVDHGGYTDLLEGDPVNNQTQVPNQFQFVIPGQLAGMAKFDKNSKSDYELREIYAKYLVEQGVKTVISIEKEDHRRTKRAVESVGIEWFSCFLTDWHAPSVEQLHEYNLLVSEKIKEGGAVATHCWGGTGRTSCFLASYLLYSKLATSAQDAFKQIRERWSSHSIEMKVQYNALARYSDFLGNAPSLPFDSRDIDFANGEWNLEHGDEGLGSDPGHLGAKGKNYDESKVNKQVVSKDGAFVRQRPYVKPERVQVQAQVKNVDISRKHSASTKENEIERTERRLRKLQQEERKLSEHLKTLRTKTNVSSRRTKIMAGKTSTARKNLRPKKYVHADQVSKEQI